MRTARTRSRLGTRAFRVTTAKGTIPTPSSRAATSSPTSTSAASPSARLPSSRRSWQVVGYESTPYTATDPDWYTRACLVGDPGASGYSTVQVQQWIKTRLKQIGYTQIDTIFGGNFVSQMTTALNRGDTIFSYRGYWQMSGWGNSNTYALTNGWKLPFGIAITCDTGSFAGGTSRTRGSCAPARRRHPREASERSAPRPPGRTRSFNNCVHYGIFYGLLYQDHWTMGAALTRGKLELYVNYQNVDPNRVVDLVPLEQPDGRSRRRVLHRDIPTR